PALHYTTIFRSHIQGSRNIIAEVQLYTVFFHIFADQLLRLLRSQITALDIVNLRIWEKFVSVIISFVLVKSCSCQNRNPCQRKDNPPENIFLLWTGLIDLIRYCDIPYGFLDNLVHGKTDPILKNIRFIS